MKEMGEFLPFELNHGQSLTAVVQNLPSQPHQSLECYKTHGPRLGLAGPLGKLQIQASGDNRPGRTVHLFDRIVEGNPSGMNAIVTVVTERGIFDFIIGMFGEDMIVDEIPIPVELPVTLQQSVKVGDMMYLEFVRAVASITGQSLVALHPFGVFPGSPDAFRQFINVCKSAHVSIIRHHELASVKL